MRNAHGVPTFVGVSRESFRPGKLLPKELATGRPNRFVRHPGFAFQRQHGANPHFSRGREKCGLGLG